MCCARSGANWVLGLAVVVLVTPVLVGQLRPASPGSGRPANSRSDRPPPLVTLTKVDGSTLRGEVVSSTPDDVIFKPARKATDQADPEDITIPWSQIKRLSNGLTQQKALDAWKQEHREQLCEACRGDRMVLCSTCKGTMHDPASAADCKTCKGELLVDCKAPKCKQGVIPCPSTCLKLTEGNWTHRPDGLRWRVFRTSRGMQEWSENNVGELVVVEDGQWANKGKCPTCGGKTTLDCPACRGRGQAPCATCTARTDAPKCTGGCDHGRVSCETCNATGLKP